MGRKGRLPDEVRGEVRHTLELLRDLLSAIAADVERDAPSAAIRDGVRGLHGEVHQLAALVKVEGGDAS